MAFQKSIIREGNGQYTPLPWSRCQIKVECGDTPSRKIEFKEVLVNNTCEITLGEWDAAADGIVHSCVGSMLEGETCEITFSLNIEVSGAEKTTDDDKNTKTKNFTGEITLYSFTKGVELWEMAQEDRLKAASHHKSKGTVLYKNQDLRGAFRRYSLAAKYLISVGKEEDIIASELRTKWKTLGAQVYLNMAACQLQSDFHEAVIENCSKALTFDEKNVKGYFRRAQSRCKLKDFDSARNDLLHAQKLEANNTAVEKLLKHVESELYARESKMANAMSKMFSS